MFLLLTLSSSIELKPRPSYVSGKLIADLARTKLGHDYVHGDEGPETFDCTGLVQWVHAQYGIKTPRTPEDMYTGGRPGDGSIGDVVVFGSPPYHGGICLGNGLCVHATSAGDGKVILGEIKYISRHFIYRRFCDDPPEAADEAKAGTTEKSPSSKFLIGLISGACVMLFIGIIVGVVVFLINKKRRNDDSSDFN